MEMLRRKIGEYYIVDHLGSGGMAHVYLAINPRTKDKRAIKFMAKRATASALSYARFLREVDILRSLAHPRIIRIYESGSTEDGYYYMMEYMAGGNLAHRLSRGRPALRELINLFHEICDGMAYAHDRNIIHRDLKPANILLNASGDPVISDFGIARILDDAPSHLTRSNEVMGTIAYLAPEQRIDAKRVDRRADVYALGAVFYEMFMGFPPLGKFPLPREIQPDFSENIQRILETCLALNPDDRYAHAGLLLRDLARFRTNQAGSGTFSLAGRKQEDIPSRGIGTGTPPDRLEEWFRVLRGGTTRERFAVVREMIATTDANDVKEILKRYADEPDSVRWGLIQMLGELRISTATPLLLKELNVPLHRECVIEALGKIGAAEAFEPIYRYVVDHKGSAMMALMPLALTGKERAIECLSSYLQHEMASIRHAAVRAMGTISSPKALSILKEQMNKEADEKIRSTIGQLVFALQTLLLHAGAGSRQETEFLGPPGSE